MTLLKSLKIRFLSNKFKLDWKNSNPNKQDVLILRFIVGLSLKEVASTLGRTIGSIKVTQHRALKELRMIIETQTGEEK